MENQNNAVHRAIYRTSRAPTRGRPYGIEIHFIRQNRIGMSGTPSPTTKRNVWHNSVGAGVPDRPNTRTNVVNNAVHRAIYRTSHGRPHGGAPTGFEIHFIRQNHIGMSRTPSPTTKRNVWHNFVGAGSRLPTRSNRKTIATGNLRPRPPEHTNE